VLLRINLLDPTSDNLAVQSIHVLIILCESKQCSQERDRGVAAIYVLLIDVSSGFFSE